jgi:hypothetical protein
MFNIFSKEYELPETAKSELGTETHPLNSLSGENVHSYTNGKRTDNAGVQDFGMSWTNDTSRVRMHAQARRLKARNCTTEVKLSGHNFGIHRGLQVLLIKSTMETREQSQYNHGGDASVIPGTTFTGPLRADFPPVERYYLIAFDPDLCHIVERAVEQDGTVHNIWHIQADTEIKATKWAIDGEIEAFYESSEEGKGRLYGMYVSLTGIDYLQAAKICQKSVAPPTEIVEQWVDWVLDSSIEELVNTTDQKDIVKAKKWIAPVVKYNEQFKDAEEIYRVGHLRFVRLADSTIGGKSDSVLDHLQWFGVMPILNVEKSVQITLDGNYYKQHTSNGCNDACNHETLELTEGKYAIDVNKTCFYYGKKYIYPHGKKAWILSMLANSQVIIEKSIADRIAPVTSMDDMSNIAYNDDDEFLNRI